MKGKNASESGANGRLGEMKGRNASDSGANGRLGEMKGKNASDSGASGRLDEMKGNTKQQPSRLPAKHPAAPAIILHACHARLHIAAKSYIDMY